jgi:hypothetical protein
MKPLTFAFAGLLFLGTGCADRAPNPAMRAVAERVVKVTLTPKSAYGFDTMRVGALQHLDRDYTYDVVPEELRGGLLFQGIHRAPTGTKLHFDLLEPATVYVFFHPEKDGGWSEAFAARPEWKRCETFPQYDIHNGKHGLTMIMHRHEAAPGRYELPVTTEDQGCFNLVFQPKQAER